MDGVNRRAKGEGQGAFSPTPTGYSLTPTTQGNAAFKSGAFPEAIGHYTTAILADRSDPTYLLNRAAAYLKLGKYVQTL